MAGGGGGGRRRGGGDGGGGGRGDGGGGGRGEPSGGGRGRGRMAPGLRPVDEGTRISIADQLAEFQRSEAKEIKFPPGLSNHDRAVVHAECRKYGFRSKSHGKGDARAVTVYKPKERSRGVDSAYDLPLCDASRAALAAYFAAHPPTPAELAAAGSGAAGGGGPATSGTDQPASPTGSDEKRRRRDGAGPAPPKAGGAAAFTPEEVARRRAGWAARTGTPAMAPLVAARASLPIAPFRDAILSAVASSQVVLVAGETGCGKTTQVPQYLLEEAWDAGKGARIVCTQPRRISAISVAERVAAERGNQGVGQDVGYAIRLESKGGPDASLHFCTNGVLLRQLTHGAGLEGITHIVCDEIHERDRFADFLLILLRDALPANPGVRLILMSATLHVDLFSAYFAGCPVVRVPGFTHPVTDFYLEDILDLVGYSDHVARGGGGSGSAAAHKNLVDAPPPGAARAKHAAAVAAANALPGAADVQEAIFQAFVGGPDAEDAAFARLLELTGAAAADAGAGEADTAATRAAAPFVNVAHPETGATALHAAAGKGRLDDVATLLANGADVAAPAADGSTPLDWAMRFAHAAVADYLRTHAEVTARADAAAAAATALAIYQGQQDPDEVDLGLVEALVAYVGGEGRFARVGEGDGPDGGGHHDAPSPSRQQQLGAILVFLPGWDEITRLKDRLEANPAFGGGRYSILPLHSLVPPADQRRVFARPPPGVRKVVLATNIAETAVTIDDVVVVINSGRAKEKSYDPYTAVSTLQAGWVSRAAERQRRGRAGRCQPGVAFHLYSRARAAALAEFQAPELQRSPLDELCLQVKLLDHDGRSAGGSGAGAAAAAAARSAAGFLARAVEPPPPAAVTNALRLLEAIGALTPPGGPDGGERLTTLGRHLAALPLAPAVGKLLLFGLLYRCLDPLLTVACTLAYRDPWVLPVDAAKRRDAAAAKAALAAAAGGASDHLAVAAAYQRWSASRSGGGGGGGGGGSAWASRNYVSPGTMMMIDGMRAQLLGELKARGLVRSLGEASVAARDAGLVRSVLACGLYPQVGRALPPAGGDGGRGGGGSERRGAVLATASADKVRIHQSSVNAGLAVPRPPPPLPKDAPPGTPRPLNPCPILVFDELTRSESSLYVRATTAVNAHAVLLTAEGVSVRPPKPVREAAAAAMEGVERDGSDSDSSVDSDAAAPDTAVLVVDEWLPLRVPAFAAAPFFVLRARLASCFADTVSHPGRPLSPAQAGAIGAASAMFSAEAGGGGGMAGPPPHLQHHHPHHHGPPPHHHHHPQHYHPDGPPPGYGGRGGGRGGGGGPPPGYGGRGGGGGGGRGRGGGSGAGGTGYVGGRFSRQRDRGAGGGGAGRGGEGGHGHLRQPPGGGGGGRGGRGGRR